MCGIIGRVGKDTNCMKTLEGLKELEYRGYDSFGVYLSNECEDLLVKDVGEFDFEKNLSVKNFQSNIEIAHTRWATHGGVFKKNAHPHFDNGKKFFIVMNGIVENFMEIKKELNYDFKTDTDTEVIVALYSCLYEDLGNVKTSLIETTKKVISKLKGEFSFLLKFENFILGYKNINPIIVGESLNEVFIASDLNLVQSNSNNYFVLNDKEFFICEYNDEIKLDFYDKDFNKIILENIKSSKVNLDIKKNTKYFMEKEIYEQKNLRNLLTSENVDSILYLTSKLKSKKIILSAAGTSYHACLYLHYQLLDLGINSQVILASELKNYVDVLDDNLVVVFSQSGETADLIYPLKELENKNEIFTITNVKNSTLDRFAKKSVILNCGKEVAVASTKAFTFNMFVSYVLKSIYLGEDIDSGLAEYEKLFEVVLQKNNNLLDRICEKYINRLDFFFIGRDSNYPLAIEAALKLKEITYIHAEGFAGGELKHGTLALIEEKVPVISIGSSQEIISNAIEIKTRGGEIVGVGSENNDIFDSYLYVPKIFEDIFSTILLQILAFKVCVKKGFNPDKPRNLAKSVTVK